MGPRPRLSSYAAPPFTRRNARPVTTPAKVSGTLALDPTGRRRRRPFETLAAQRFLRPHGRRAPAAVVAPRRARHVLAEGPARHSAAVGQRGQVLVGRRAVALVSRAAARVQVQNDGSQLRLQAFGQVAHVGDEIKATDLAEEVVKEPWSPFQRAAPAKGHEGHREMCHVRLGQGHAILGSNEGIHPFDAFVGNGSIYRHHIVLMASVVQTGNGHKHGAGHEGWEVDIEVLCHTCR